MELTLDKALQKAVEAHKAGQIQEADRLYTAILEAQPKHPDANHNMGVLAVGVGKVQEALPFFKTALEANPSISQFWLSYIDIFIKLDQKADARSVLNQAKSKGVRGEAFDQLGQMLNSPSEVSIEPPQDQLEPLINLYQQGQFQQALDNVKKLLGQFPESVTLYNIFGAVNAGLGQLDAAIRIYKHALKIKPDYAEAYNNMGNVLKDQGNLDEAVNSYQQALKIKPDYTDAHNNMGNVLKDQGNLDEAINSYQQALKIKPDYTEAYYNMGNVLKDQGNLDEAIDSYQQALKIKPDYAEAYYNMGNVLKDQGNLDEAINSYQQALKNKPDYVYAYNNMGTALKDNGNLDEAIDSYQQALKIKPDYAEAHYSMGVVLQDKDDLEAAIDSYQKALKIKPDYAEAYNNMAVVLKYKGDFYASIENCQQALKINPDYAAAYNNMGNALKDKGDLMAAIGSYKTALKIKPDFSEAYYNMGIALKGIVLNKPNSSLMEVIISLLDQRTYCRPKDIAKAAISLLKLEPALKELLKKHSLGTLRQSFQETASTLVELPLLLKLMSVCPIADIELESILLDIRSALLSSLDKISIHPVILRFQSALALQCFTNEYIYTQTDKETELLEVIENLIDKTLSTGQQPSPKAVLCLASYKALNKYKWCDLLTVNTNIEEVFTRQVYEPREESRLKANIPILQEITDKVSAKVREQYEANPYPRWVNLGLSLHPKTTSQLVKELNLRIFDSAANDRPAPNILIAGCGTGQHVIVTASRFKDCNVLAVDLSLSSLAYAKRKTEELGLQNIEYMQADILDLGKLNKKFDVIESAGVLHHMSDPMAGWKVLTDCLKVGGLLKIGLYSELARQPIAKVRQQISQSNIESTDDAMKLFRNNVIKSDKEHLELLLNSDDFYSLSTLRDLIFHVQEHRFTIPEIKERLSELDLKFCGFEVDKINEDFELKNIGKDDPYDLDKWNTYEKANPQAFVGMYQFWCQKVA